MCPSHHLWCCLWPLYQHVVYHHHQLNNVEDLSCMSKLPWLFLGYAPSRCHERSTSRFFFVGAKTLPWNTSDSLTLETCLFSFTTTLTSLVPMAFWENFLISLIAFFLNVLFYITTNQTRISKTTNLEPKAIKRQKLL